MIAGLAVPLQTVPKNWVPLSIVKGGQSANLLVKTMESEWGRKLYGKTLITNIAKAVYQASAPAVDWP